MHAILGSRLLAAILGNTLEAYWAPDESRFERFEIVLEIQRMIIARIGCLKEGNGPVVRVNKSLNVPMVSVTTDVGMSGGFVLICDTRVDALVIARGLRRAFSGSTELARSK